MRVHKINGDIHGLSQVFQCNSKSPENIGLFLNIAESLGVNWVKEISQIEKTKKLLDRIKMRKLTSSSPNVRRKLDSKTLASKATVEEWRTTQRKMVIARSRGVSWNELLTYDVSDQIPPFDESITAEPGKHTLVSALKTFCQQSTTIIQRIAIKRQY